MFASLRRLLGLIEVRETGDMITLSGLPGDTVQKSIYDIWENHKIAQNVFTHLGKSEVTFNKFFAPDVLYIFQRIIGEKRKGHNIRALKKVVAMMLEHTWLKTTTQQHPRILNYNAFSELNITFMPHQMGFFEVYNEMVPKWNLRGYLLGADPGTGKTLMCVGLSLALGADVVVFVCPKNAVERVWADTLRDRFKKQPKFWTSMDGTEPTRDAKYYICHFAALEKLLAFMKTRQRGRLPFIALDESHGLNEYDSARTQFFIELCKTMNAQHVIWSSGTPIKAIGREATPLFSTIDPYFDHDAQQRFQAIYGKAARRANDILSARMGKVHYHVSKGDVLNNVVHTHTVRVVLKNGRDYTLDALKVEMGKFVKDRVEYYRKNMRSYERAYNDILDQFEKTLNSKEEWQDFKTYKSYIKEIRKGFDPVAMRDMSAFCNHYEKKIIMPTLTKEQRDAFKDIRSIIKYYMLKVQGEALGRVLGAKRAQCHVDMVTQGEWFITVQGKWMKITLQQLIDQALKKTIIFSSYVEVVTAAEEMLKREGYKPALATGAVSNELAAIVGRFDKDEDLNPMCATFATLSTAVPLVMANSTIMVNVPFRSYEYQQAVARTDRHGQDEEVYIWNVKLDTGDVPNISTRSHDIMAWSKQQVAEILGGPGAKPTSQAALESFFENDGLDVLNNVAPSVHHVVSLEEFAEMEEYDHEWTAKGYIQAPEGKPSWTNW